MGTRRIVFSGSGGQGIITAGIILAEAAAIHENLNAVQTQVYGPEARGGATRSDVIISEEPIHYPKVENPHYLVCLTQEAYNKYAGLIRPDGVLLTDSHFARAEPKIDARQVELPMYDAVMDQIGKPIVFNICMLGAFTKLTGIVKDKSIVKVLKTKIPPDFIRMNQRALEIGLRLAEKCQHIS